MLIMLLLARAVPNGSLIWYRDRVYQVADVYTYVNLAMTTYDLVPITGADPRIFNAHFQDTAVMEVHIPLM